ncbi:uncharacterized protein LOC144079318 [Stigmatopora argus]
MTAAKTAKKGKMGLGTKVALALLSLWSLVSLVVIVTWATSPDLQSSARCRQELRESRERSLGAQELWARDKEQLDEELRRSRQESERREAALQLMAQSLRHANLTLDDCRQRQVLLLANVSSLREEAELQLERHLNLSEELRRQEGHAEALRHNLTQSRHLEEACSSLKAAADNQASAAQTQTRACRADRDYLRKQLVECQEAKSRAAPPPQSRSQPTSQTGSGSRFTTPSAAALALALWAGLLAS